MCRLYGFLANEPTKVECTLVLAQNALLIQSQSDSTGRSHADGWGIGFYTDTKLAVERRASAAFEDLHFSTTAERVYSHAVVAHVRRATVGRASIENTHPFCWDQWTFAHNGTLTAIDRLRPRLERETADRFASARRGTTDSECVFLWLLSQMDRAGIPPDSQCWDAGALAELIGESVQRLARWCKQARAEKAPKLNLLITDGRVLAATRWGNSLYWVGRDGVRDCEICGIPHIHHDPNKSYRAAVVASEPISHEDWQEAPERSVLSIDAEVHVRVQPM